MYPSANCQFCTIKSRKWSENTDASHARLLQPTARNAYAPIFCKGRGKGDYRWWRERMQAGCVMGVYRSRNGYAVWVLNAWHNIPYPILVLHNMYNYTQCTQ